MELIAQFDAPDTIGMETCFQRMGKAKWLDKWPRAETDIIHAFYDALVRNTLTELSHRRPGGSILDNINLDIVLQFIVVGGGDFDRMLNVWERADDPQAAIHMAYFTNSIRWKNSEPYMDMRDIPGATVTQKHRIARFLLRPEVEARMEKALPITDREDWRHWLEEALPLKPSSDKSM